CRIRSGVRLCWELEEPKGPTGGTGHGLLKGCSGVLLAGGPVKNRRADPHRRPGALLDPRDRYRNSRVGPSGEHGRRRHLKEVGDFLVQADHDTQQVRGPQGGKQRAHQRSWRPRAPLRLPCGSRDSRPRSRQRRPASSCRSARGGNPRRGRRQPRAGLPRGDARLPPRQPADRQPGGARRAQPGAAPRRRADAAREGAPAAERPPPRDPEDDAL
ncbi:hypothetical protein T484DRAFT_1910929, partial [Baffinella frigidus]